MPREHEYEITNNKTDKVLGRVWWNGKKIESDPQELVYILEGCPAGGKSVEDGIEYLNKLSFAFKNGLMSAKKV